jgi:ribosomal protein L12E/L44/L45/RPP1/RPP2
MLHALIPGEMAVRPGMQPKKNNEKKNNNNKKRKKVEEEEKEQQQEEQQHRRVSFTPLHFIVLHHSPNRNLETTDCTKSSRRPLRTTSIGSSNVSPSGAAEKEEEGEEAAAEEEEAVLEVLEVLEVPRCSVNFCAIFGNGKTQRHVVPPNP